MTVASADRDAVKPAVSPARTLNVVALSGSLRRGSLNTRLLHQARRLAPAGMNVVRLTGLHEIPHFDEDLEFPAPPSAQRLRERVAAADGLLIEVDHSGSGSWVALDPGSYRLEPLNADANGGAYAWWTIGANAEPGLPVSPRPLVRVTAHWGWSQVPDQVAEATVITPVAGAILGGAANWSVEPRQVLAAAASQVLGLLAGMALAALILNTPAAICAHVGCVFVLPMVLVGLSLWEPAAQVTPWLDFTSAQSALGAPMAAEQWGQLAVSGGIFLVLPMVLGWVRIARSEVS